jgi:dihydroflavonol-4-reductase
MTALVTGATGFLGNHVARQLAARGEQVRVLARPSSDRRALADFPAEIVEGDLRDAASLARALGGVKHVFHVAADYRFWAREPGEIYESNVAGTRNLLEAAQRAGVEKFIYTSTVATVAVERPALGDALPDETTETTLGEMIGHYKRSKWLAENEARKAAQDGQPVVIVMPTTPIGPGDWKPTPTGKLIVDFLNGKMPAYVHTGLNFVAVEDAAAGHLLAAEKGKVGERYLLGGENLTLKQVLEALARITGRKAPRLRIPHAVALAAAYADEAMSRLRGRAPQITIESVKVARHMMFVDCSKARRELGFTPGPVEAAFERAVRWYEANGYEAPRGANGAAVPHAA